MIKKFWLFHPFLVALAPAVFLWQETFPGDPPKGLITALAVLIIFAGLVYLIVWLFYRDLNKTAIFTSVFLLLFLSHSYIYNSAFGRIFASGFLVHLSGFISSLIILAAVIFFLKKTKNDLLATNKVFAVISCFFLLISFVRIGLSYQPLQNRAENQIDIDISLVKTSEPRDIYYIILDSYSSPQVLKEVMGYDEIDQFVSFLKDRGFFVAEQSSSNYPHTELSLPSALNLRYLEESEMETLSFRRKMLEDNVLQRVFRSLGYSYLHFGTVWRTWKNRYADENITTGDFFYYQTSLWHITALYPAQLFVVRNFLGADALNVLDRVSFLSNSVQHAKDTQFKLQELAKVPDREGPNFIFAHMMIPHRPYVFDAEGNFLPYKERVKKSEMENYLGQVAYINKEMMILIDKILENSEPEPIIIIQADHGAGFFENQELNYQILNAYYFPDGGDQVLYDSITPVNSFRVLLNYYFGQNLELLEDKTK